MNEKPTLLFSHIPKTAGTSVSLALAARFAPRELYHVRLTQHAGAPYFSPNHGPEEEFRALQPEARAAFRCLIGHFRFGLHESIPRPCEYFTLLRNPLERYLSQVAQYNRMASGGELKDGAEPVSLYGFRGVKPAQFENPQARWLAGLTWHEYQEVDRDELLERAQRNLSDSFRVVGVVERYAESLQALAGHSGWGRMVVRRENASRRKPSTEEFSPSQREEFDACNELDWRLWRFANELLDGAVIAASRRAPRYVPGALIRKLVRTFRPRRAA